MPYVTNGNIYAPVMMLAEKAADLILGVDAARRPSRSPFYRHDPAAAGQSAASLASPVSGRCRRGRCGHAGARSPASTTSTS